MHKRTLSGGPHFSSCCPQPVLPRSQARTVPFPPCSSRTAPTEQSPAASPAIAPVPRGTPLVPLAPAAPSHLRLYSSRSLFTLASTL